MALEPSISNDRVESGQPLSMALFKDILANILRNSEGGGDGGGGGIRIPLYTPLSILKAVTAPHSPIDLPLFAAAGLTSSRLTYGRTGLGRLNFDIYKRRPVSGFPVNDISFFKEIDVTANNSEITSRITTRTVSTAQTSMVEYASAEIEVESISVFRGNTLIILKGSLLNAGVWKPVSNGALGITINDGAGTLQNHKLLNVNIDGRPSVLVEGILFGFANANFTSYTVQLRYKTVTCTAPPFGLYYPIGSRITINGIKGEVVTTSGSQRIIYFAEDELGTNSLGELPIGTLSVPAEHGLTWVQFPISETAFNNFYQNGETVLINGIPALIYRAFYQTSTTSGELVLQIPEGASQVNSILSYRVAVSSRSPGVTLNLEAGEKFITSQGKCEHVGGDILYFKNGFIRDAAFSVLRTAAMKVTLDIQNHGIEVGEFVNLTGLFNGEAELLRVTHVNVDSGDDNFVVDIDDTIDERGIPTEGNIKIIEQTKGPVVSAIYKLLQNIDKNFLPLATRDGEFETLAIADDTSDGTISLFFREVPDDAFGIEIILE